MPSSADLTISQSVGPQYSGAGTNYIIQTPSGAFYIVFVDSLTDVLYKKSTDGGYTWEPPVLIFTGTITCLSVWYDRWSGIAAGLIHCAYTESATDDTLYRTINTESADALSTQTVIFAGASTAGFSHLSITRAVGGNVYCKTVIDAGVEGGFYRLPNANVPNGAWDAARTVDEAIATQDQMILLPNLTAADSNDIMAIFWDSSADEISRKLYDDSGNSWSETSISGSMLDGLATTSFPHFDVAVDITNNQVVLVAWSAIDTANADLRCWTITDSAITEVTNVVQNSTDDQGLAAISIDTNTGYWYAYYVGASAGGETYPTSVRVYCKCSKDAGSTWGPETLVSTAGLTGINWLSTCPRLLYGRQVFAYYRNSTYDEILFNVKLQQPRSNYLIGI